MRLTVLRLESVIGLWVFTRLSTLSMDGKRFQTLNSVLLLDALLTITKFD